MKRNNNELITVIVALVLGTGLIVGGCCMMGIYWLTPEEYELPTSDEPADTGPSEPSE